MNRHLSTRQNSRWFMPRLGISAVLLLASFGLFVYWSWGWVIPLISLAALIAGFIVNPWNQDIVKKLITRKGLAAIALSAIAISVISVVIPFPPDIPPCCMVGPMRERGLPITYITQQKSFSDNDGSWHALDDEYGDHHGLVSIGAVWLMADVMLWALYIFYGVHGMRSLKARGHAS